MTIKLFTMLNYSIPQPAAHHAIDEKGGIARTSKLEQTLFDDMNGLCREHMAELPAPVAVLAGPAGPTCIWASQGITGTGLPRRSREQ